MLKRQSIRLLGICLGFSFAPSYRWWSASHANECGIGTLVGRKHRKCFTNKGPPWFVTGDYCSRMALIMEENNDYM